MLKKETNHVFFAVVISIDILVIMISINKESLSAV